MKSIVRFFLFLVLALPVYAATFPSDGSRADVQAKIDLAADGDTVTLPAGAFTWTSGVTVSGKGIRIQGGGGTRMIARSISSVTLGTGTKSFVLKTMRAKKTLAEYLSVTPGDPVRVWRMQGDTPYYLGEGAPVYMDGTVSSYNPGTETLEVSVSSATGTAGTYQLWMVETRPTGRTTITQNFSAAIISITEDTTHSTEVKDIAFISVTGGSTFNCITITGVAGGKPALIHDNSFQLAQSGGAAISIYLKTNKGVIYNNSFFNRIWGESTFCLEVKPTAEEPNSWSTASTMGTADTTGTKNIYIEDCDFSCFLNGTNFADNSRAVVRHTMFNNAGIGTHGPDSDPEGQRHLEIYDSEFVIDYITPVTMHVLWMGFLRGGTGIITDNILPGPNSDWNPAGVALAILNLGATHGSWGAGAQNITGISVANPTMITTSTGHGMATSDYVRITNSNSTPTINGYRQITALTSNTYTVAVNVTGSGNTGKSNKVNYHVPHQIGRGFITAEDQLEPWYVWNNSPDPARISVSGESGVTDQDLSEDYIKLNREYYTSASPSWVKPTGAHASAYPHPLRTDATQVTAPIFSPVAGSYGSAQNVTITSATVGASIRYKDDGSTPTSSSGTVYSSPVSISTTTTLKAIAYNGVLTDSTVTSGVYTITGQVNAPVFDPVAGTYGSAQVIALTSATGGASIRYTTDGSTPTSSSGTVYTSPVNIAVTTTLKAIAYNGVLTDSNVTTGIYTIITSGVDLTVAGTVTVTGTLTLPP